MPHGGVQRSFLVTKTFVITSLFRLIKRYYDDDSDTARSGHSHIVRPKQNTVEQGILFCARLESKDILLVW